MLRREGLPPDGVILAPSVTATPMRHLENAWAMLVLAVMSWTTPTPTGKAKSTYSPDAGCPNSHRPPCAREISSSC